MTDTSSEAKEVQLALIRCMTPTERTLKALRLTARLMLECKPALVRINSHVTPREIGIAFIELNYGKELATAVDQYQLDQAQGQSPRDRQRTAYRFSDV